jgi:SAM-dependent methyltransferase
MLHSDRRRATSFGENADAYDRTRPTYPAAMIDDLVSTDPHDVLDVGCGTGIASRLFAARGCRVLGVELDPRMAEVATGHGLSVEVSSFEEWEPCGRVFDLLICGQAWHWVDPVDGPIKAAGLVRPDGEVALFWNYGHVRDPLRSALSAIYDRLPEGPGKHSIVLGNPYGNEDWLGRIGAQFAATGLFAEAVVSRYPWSTSYRTEEWVEQILTHSDHRTMDTALREGLIAEVRATIASLGGHVDSDYTTYCIRARRLR